MVTTVTLTLTLQFLRDNNVFPFFLRSGNSEQDQPNDNGPNASLKDIYSLVLEDKFSVFNTQGHFRAVGMNPSLFNEIFKAAWITFTATAKDTVVKAWKRTGLHPFDPSASNYSAETVGLSAFYTGDAPEGLLSPDGKAPTARLQVSRYFSCT